MGFTSFNPSYGLALLALHDAWPCKWPGRYAIRRVGAVPARAVYVRGPVL